MNLPRIMRAEQQSKKGIDSEMVSLNAELLSLEAGERIEFLAERFTGRIVATTSFGLQSAVMLKLLRDHAPSIPVIFIDTGYLFPETYRYAALLEEELDFRAHVYIPGVTAARQEALHGKQWEDDPEGMNNYARVHKVEPMNRALQDLGADAWISGLRREQSRGRSRREIAELQARTLKAYPIIDWNDERVENFIKSNGLPQHPLASAGYVTMGDWHSTSPGSTSSRESTRFKGERFECGLHLESGQQDFQI